MDSRGFDAVSGHESPLGLPGHITVKHRSLWMVGCCWPRLRGIPSKPATGEHGFYGSSIRGISRIKHCGWLLHSLTNHSITREWLREFSDETYQLTSQLSCHFTASIKWKKLYHWYSSAQYVWSNISQSHRYVGDINSDASRQISYYKIILL